MSGEISRVNNNLSRREFMKVLMLSGAATAPLFIGEKVCRTPSLWGTYEVGDVDLGAVWKVGLLKNESVGLELAHKVGGLAKSMKIESPQFSYMEIQGERSSVVMPLVWSLDRSDRAKNRGIVWQMQNRKIVPIGLNSEIKNDLVLVKLFPQKIEFEDRTTLTVIGPVRVNDEGILTIPLFYLISKYYKQFLRLPFRNIYGSGINIPLESDVVKSLDDFLRVDV